MSEYKKKHTHSRHAFKRYLKRTKTYGKSHDKVKLSDYEVTVNKQEDKEPVSSDFKKQKKALKETLVKDKERLKQEIDEARKDYQKQKVSYKENQKSLRKQESQHKKAVRKENRQKHGSLIVSVLISIFVTFGVLILATVLWLIRTWPYLKMDELIYEATAPLEGTGSNMITGYLLQCGLPALIALIAVITGLCILRKKGSKIRKIGKSILTAAAAVCIAVSGTLFWNHLDVKAYLENQNSDTDFIGDNYVDPSSVNITFPEQKRNLIYIYLESMEMTYSNKANGGGFDDNYIPELTKLSEENENFSGHDGKLNGAHSLPGTTWTMGGIFGATSGLPLQVSIDGNSMDTQSSFFPGITSLGDILEQQGYNQVFECGSDANFGGRALYFQDHENYDIHDINYFKSTGQLPEDYYVWWGYEDEKLINFAKEDLTELASEDKPFNYTMLTVDTHFEDGYVCDLCDDKYGDNQYANVIACSSRQVSEFVSWIQEQPWYDNTTIILSGDHPTMDSDFCDPVSPDYQRRVYTAYINADAQPADPSEKRDYTTMDNFPTTLAALGAEIDGNRLGLGTNLFSDEKTLCEEMGFDVLSSYVGRKSDFMTKAAMVDLNARALQERTGEIPGAEASIVSYDPISGSAEISVHDLLFADNIRHLDLDITDENNQVEQIQMTLQNDGAYLASIPIPDEARHLEVNAYIKTDGTDELRKETLFTYEGNLHFLSSQGNDLQAYLHDLSLLDVSRYTIFMVEQGDASAHLRKSDAEAFEALHIPSSFIMDDQNAHLAIVSDDGITLKEGNDSAEDTGYINNALYYYVRSSSGDDTLSSVQIGRNQFGPQGNGINFVVLDKDTSSVVSQYAYDSTQYGPEASLKATYDSDNHTVMITASDFNGILDMKAVSAVVAYKDKRSQIMLNASDNGDGTYSGSLKTDDDWNSKNMRVIVYGQASDGRWYRAADSKVKNG